MTGGPPADVKLIDWDDVPTRRQMIFDGVKDAFVKQFPMNYAGISLGMKDIHYDSPRDFSLAEQKKALLDNRFLHWKLKGIATLSDPATGQVIEERPMTMMKVPYLTQRGTFIHNGSEYVTNSQARLLPGVYTRRKATGELETHFNVKRNTGNSFRIYLEPDTGVFKMNFQQSSLRLYSLLHDLGVPDEKLEKAWGPDLLDKNRKAYDSRVFEKAYQKLVKKPDLNLSREEKSKAILVALQASKLNRSVVSRTLPNLFTEKFGTRKQALLQIPDPVPVPDDRNEFSKADYLLLAQFLNENFKAGIPLDLPIGEIVDVIVQKLQSLMADFKPELVNKLLTARQATV